MTQRRRVQAAPPKLEVLESRLVPATHTWTGLGSSNVWSDPNNWDIGAPAYNESHIDLVFGFASGFATPADDLSGLVVDAITIEGNRIISAAARGTSLTITNGIYTPLSGVQQFDDSFGVVNFASGAGIFLKGFAPGAENELHINCPIVSEGVLFCSGTTPDVSFLQLNGNNSQSVGDFSLSSLTLQVGTDSALGTGAVSFNTLPGDTSAVLSPMNGTRTIANAINLTTGGTIASDEAGDGMILNGPIAGSGLLTLDGTGFGILLDGVNSFTGGTNVSGAVGFNNNSAFGNGTVACVSGSQLVGLADGLTLVNAINTSGNLILPENGSLALNGVISGVGGLVISSGTVTLDGTNTFAGDATVDAGTLSIENNSALGTGGLVFQDGAILDAVGGSVSIANPVQLAGKVTTQGSSLTLSGNISGTGSLVVDCSGESLLLSGVNTYQGTTDVQAGGLAIQSPTALPGSTALTIEGKASLSLQSNMTVGSLSGTGPIYFEDPFAITTGGDNTNTTYSGSVINLEGFGFKTSLTKIGTGVFTFSGTTGYSGATTVAGGTLQLDGNINGTVVVNAAATVTGTGTAGSLDISGTAVPGDAGTPGVLQCSGAATFEKGSNLEIPATAAGTAQLASGSINLAMQPGLGSTLSFAPALASSSTITTANTINGTFLGMPDGNCFKVNTTWFTIHYLATSITLTVSPAPLAAITATSGNQQSTPFGNSFASPLVLTVTDADGNVVPGITVTFTTPSGGAGCTLHSSSAVTDKNGQVSELVTANGTAGSYQVSAAVAGVATPATLQLTNLPGSISGEVFQDINDDGVQETNEPGLAGQELFLDLNGSGVLQAGDPTALTNNTDKYQFTITSAGPETVRPVLLGGELLGSPTAQDYVDTFTTGVTLAGQNFAEVPTSIAVPLTLPPITPFPKQGSANADFVEAVYRSVLDRNADPGGLANWTSALNRGAITPLQLVQGIRQAPEHLTQEVTDFLFHDLESSARHSGPQELGAGPRKRQADRGASGL
jgi:autotransporter-associated beta strand protein